MKFFCNTWPTYHIKLPSGTHIRFEHGEIEIKDEAVAAELRKHMYYGSMITENVSVPWATSIMEGGEVGAVAQEEGQEEGEVEPELASLFPEGAPSSAPSKPRPKPKRRK